MKKCKMPPVVYREETFGRPLPGVSAQPGDAIAAPALHLHHVRNGVVAPAVARLHLDARTPLQLGIAIVARLLETKGVHAEHCVVAGNRTVPCRERSCDAISQHARVAGEE